MTKLNLPAADLEWIEERKNEIRAMESIRDSLRENGDMVSAMTIQGCINRLPEKYQDRMLARMGRAPYWSEEVDKAIREDECAYCNERFSLCDLKSVNNGYTCEDCAQGCPHDEMDHGVCPDCGGEFYDDPKGARGEW